MPNYTENLELFKYDVEADKKSTFNIGLALNDNFDKIDAKVGEMETQQANIDLSNLSTTGNSKLNAKANIDLSNLSTTGEKRFEDINTQIAKTVLQSDLYDSNGHIKIDKMSFPYIKEKYVSGTSWYRIWSDGWIEQGGLVVINKTNSSFTGSVAFIKKFTNANYTITHSAEGTGLFAVNINDLTTSGFTVYQTGFSSNTAKNDRWYACGY